MNTQIVFTPKEIESIYDSLQSSIESFKKELDILERNNERPAMVKYLKEDLIPSLESSYKLVCERYYSKQPK